MFLVDVTQVSVPAQRKLSLVFADGQSGTVDVDAIIGKYSGVFAALLDPDFFARVTVNPELGTVVWPNGADLCPDVLYAHATGQTERLLSAIAS
jgi:hypothetical protein